MFGILNFNFIILSSIYFEFIFSDILKFQPHFPSNQECLINLNTEDKTQIEVENFYLSFCIDSLLFDSSLSWSKAFNPNSKRFQTLVQALSPSVLRIGGSPANFLFFDLPLQPLLSSFSHSRPYLMTKQNLSDLILFTKKTKSKLLLDLNSQTRFGYEWDPTNTIRILSWLQDQNFSDQIFFELGNEPDWLLPSLITPDLLSRDFQALSRVLRTFPSFSSTPIVGPDVVSTQDFGKEFLEKVVNNSGHLLKAVTFHHYYFRGDQASYKDYINPNYFDLLRNSIIKVKQTLTPTLHPLLPLWLGETSDAWHTGTPGVSDRFASSFLWLDKLGLSALMGVKAVFRQTLFGMPYALITEDYQPTPDYWLSWIFKQLVGTKVLLPSTLCSSGLPFHLSRNWGIPKYFNQSQADTFRFYSHCTKESHMYKKGLVTFFGLNLDLSSFVTLSFPPPFAGKMVDFYIIQPGSLEKEKDKKIKKKKKI